jgi:uncharacterized membrane protein
MAHRVKPTQTEKSSPALYWASFALACLGVLDAVYLLVYKLTGNDAMCLASGGCHDVNFSPYSEIGGIPVSVFGIIAFVTIAGILLLEPRLKVAEENGPLVLFGISLAGVAFEAYLTWLEVYVIHAICPFCVATMVIISLIFILAVIRLAKQLTH